MSKCSNCGAPARHVPPDGDFRYDPSSTPRTVRLFGNEAELIKRLVIPMVLDRSREHGDAWDQAHDLLIRLT